MKKRILSSLTLCVLLFSTTAMEARDQIAQYGTESDDLWQTGVGANDGAYTAISSSMLAWGAGLAVGIAILAAALNSSGSSGGGGGAHCH